ncbi:MAG: threonine/serine exporter family protein [Gordonia sp. (in: high G+C Gram-positive bacteria)]|uniref:threonine/serine exporter family protein n=1 Tax=Gordonia sp. (in: high G+C Gram-positive bacteria) TaxID=84139 RepID=UPI0039E5A97B
MSAPVVLAPAEARPRVDALSRLTVALIGSGFAGGEALFLAERCAHRLDLGDAEILDFGSAVSVQYVAADGSSVMRTARTDGVGTINCREMKYLSQVAEATAAGTLDARGVLTALEAIDARSGPKVWVTAAGLAVLAFAIALQVGIGWLPALLTAVAQIFVTLFAALLGRLGVNRLFGCAAQAILAASLIGLAYRVGAVTGIDAAAAMAVPWLLTIPLPILIALVVDVVYNRPAGAVVRGFVVVLGGGGVALGAYAVLSVLQALDPPVHRDITLPTLPIWLGLVASIVGAVANAMANGGGRDLLLPAAVIGLFTASVNQTLIHAAHFPPGWATLVASAVLGYCCAFWSRRSPYPVSALALMGITGAILPGLTVYEGVAETVFGGDGTAAFEQAIMTGVGIGVGVAAGVLLATRRLVRRD